MGAWRVILQVVGWPLRAGEEVGAFVAPYVFVGGCVGAGIKRGRGKGTRRRSRSAGSRSSAIVGNAVLSV